MTEQENILPNGGHDIVSIGIRIPVSQELMDNKEALKSFTTSVFKDECKVLDISLVGEVTVSDSMQTINGMHNCVIAMGRVVSNAALLTKESQ